MVTLSGWGNENTFEYTVFDGEPATGPGRISLAGFQSGVPALAWLSAQGIQVQFMDLLGNNDPDPFFGRVTVSDGLGDERNVQIADALVAYGVAWEETGANGRSVIKLSGVAQEQAPFGGEYMVGEGETVVNGNGNVVNINLANRDSHSMSMGAYDIALDTTIPDPDDPTGTIDATAAGVNIVWVSSNAAGTNHRIMLQRYHLVMDETGHPAGFQAAGIDGQAEAHAVHSAADAAFLDLNGIAFDDSIVQVANSGGTGNNVQALRDPGVVGLHTGDTLVTWVQTNVDGTELIRAALFPPNGVVLPSDTALNGLTQAHYDAVNAALARVDNNQTRVAAGQTVKVQELGPGNFAIMWVSEGATEGSFELNGRFFALPPDGANGETFNDGWTEFAIDPIELMPGFTGEFNIGGMGEDITDLVITYVAGDGDGTGVYAVHVDGTNINVDANGNPTGPVVHSEAFLVNTSTEGNQSNAVVTGLISDRAMIAFLDEASGDVNVRMIDTRDAGQELIGDQIIDRDDNFVLSDDDRLRSRPDIIVGTVGDDLIIGDMVDPPTIFGDFDVRLRPEDDEVYGGLGNDILFGGGGFDIIDGGMNLFVPNDALGAPVLDPTLGLSEEAYTDRAIFLGENIYYNIWINGDGSYSVLDARFDDGTRVVDELDDGTLNLDGWDIVNDVEQYHFLEGDIEWMGNVTYSRLDTIDGNEASTDAAAGHVVLDSSDFYQIRGQDERITGNVDENDVFDTDPAGIETVSTPVGWGNTREEADYGLKITDELDAGGVAIAETKPVIGATADGFVIGWTNENVDPATTTFKFNNYDALMQLMPPADGENVVVSANVVAGGPAVVNGLGAATIAVWLEDTGTGLPRYELRAQQYDLEGIAIGNVQVVTGTDSPTAIGQVSLSEQAMDGSDFGTQFTVTWIENADASGVGTIMAQRYYVPIDAVLGEQEIVAVGRDGTPAGDNGVFSPLDGEIVLGRGATSAGAHDGEIAFVWADALGDITGTVIRPFDLDEEPGVDAPVFSIALNAANFANFVSAHPDYDPKVLSAGEGDLVVGWINANGVAQAAVFPILGQETWGTPELLLELNDFSAALPSEFNISVVGEDGPNIIVT